MMHASWRPSLSPNDALPNRRNTIEDVFLALRPQAHSDLSVPSPKFDRSININALDSYPNALDTASITTNGSPRTSFSSARSAQTAATSPVVSRRSSWQPSSPTHKLDLRSLKRTTTAQGAIPIAQQKFPIEVFVCILQQLRVIHEASNSLSCSSCFNRDASSLALVSRAWDKAVRRELYSRIYLDGVDAPAQLKKHKLSAGSRLKLLRRTLRDRRALSETVREIRVSNPLPSGSLSPQFIDQVASVIMTCPNLEIVTGFHPSYDHKFSRLYHALATRKKLKQHIWILGENEGITDRSSWQLPPGLMDLEQTSMFLRFHASWHELTTLVLHAQPGAILEHGVFVSVFRLLPSLAHLSISSFDTDDFHDATLLSLQPLTSLRLAYLPGITSQGLASLASSHQQTSLNSLSLISLPVTSLLVISKLIFQLPLSRFTLSQPQIPTLPTDTITFPPVLASPHLSYLHWDIQSPPPLDTATPHLAASIFHGAFPSLLTIRAPSDSGTLQSLCAPRSQIALPSDKFSSIDAYASSNPGSPLLSLFSTTNPTTNNSTTPTTPTAPRSSTSSRTSRSSVYLPNNTSGIPHNNILRHSRVRAQARLDAARKHVGVRVIVQDDEGKVSKDISFPGWMGRVGSRIRYVLESDIESNERALGEESDLLGVGSIGGSSGGGLGGGSGSGSGTGGNGWEGGKGCQGLWNAGHSGGRKWFAHVERGRWRGVGVEKLF